MTQNFQKHIARSFRIYRCGLNMVVHKSARVVPSKHLLLATLLICQLSLNWNKLLKICCGEENPYVKYAYFSISSNPENVLSVRPSALLPFRNRLKEEKKWAKEGTTTASSDSVPEMWSVRLRTRRPMQEGGLWASGVNNPYCFVRSVNQDDTD